MIQHEIVFFAGYIFGLIVYYLIKKYVWDKRKKLDRSIILKNHFKKNNLMTSETYEKFRNR